ncbi:hypothetical protein LAZ67_2000108 [Cordylochernes scorpioides]|uniref:Transposase n=1 Tax=Cordylochernes scorpioides TaxID=51811 RepID=A0ABY6K200_9ARAC|nr:hypothetical protein LAZ67_2000108 [Cordylochernes scorpioides]
MRNLREAIRQKSPDLWKNKNWLLHHDNAPAHTSLLVRDFLAKNNTLMKPQPPYSPDLAPCDFFLFPKLKRPMKGRHGIEGGVEKDFFKNEFLKCFENWKNRWHKCIISHGDYFEGDKIERNLIKFIKQRKLTFAGHVMLGSAGETLLTVLEGRDQGKGDDRYTDDLKQWTGRHEEMKKMADEALKEGDTERLCGLPSVEEGTEGGRYGKTMWPTLSRGRH